MRDSSRNFENECIPVQERVLSETLPDVSKIYGEFYVESLYGILIYFEDSLSHWFSVRHTCPACSHTSVDEHI